jgi:RNA polymerase sporulation-specific sigma factor
MLENSELLKRLDKGDESAKELLIENNMGLVYSIVNKLDNRMYEREDLVQIGAIGLIKAVDKFDTSYNVQFSTYAVPMILGEIKRFLRDDGAIKVSRSVKEAALKGRKCRDKLEKKLGRTPTIGEISAECDIACDVLMEAFEASIPPESLQAATVEGEENLTLMGLVSGEEEENELVDKLLIKESLKSLTDRERDIIIMRYYKGKTQTEIAERIGVSQVQISRIEKKALMKMRNSIQCV